MKKASSMMIVLVTILCVFPLSVPQANAQPSDWIRLTTNPHGDNYPDYSPDGEKIAYIHGKSDHWHRDLYIMDADGSNQELLIEGPGGGVGSPNWSPDGTKIVYQEYHNDYRTDIMVIDVNSKEVTGVVEDWGSNHTPKWSPDGSKILFNHEHKHVPGGLWNLYTINIDGTSLTQITYGDYHYCTPDWSPDGSKIVVARALVHDEPHDVFLMDANGSNEFKLVDMGQHLNFFPDGERVLFWRPGPIFPHNLFSVNIDGTNVVQLTDCPSDWVIGEGTVSPDGREITFKARPISESYPNIYKIIVGEPPVGGNVAPINIPISKPELQIPWIWLTTIILAVSIPVAHIKYRKKQ